MSKIIGIDLGYYKQLCRRNGRRRACCHRKR